MAKRRTSTYRPAKAREGGSASGGSGVRPQLHLPGLRREVALIGGLAAAVVLAVATLGGAFLLAKADHDWTSVATVNGHSISREQLRARVSVLTFLVQERYAFIGHEAPGSFFTPDERSGLEASASAPLNDIVSTARESLIDDELKRDLAAREAVATPAAPDPWAQALAYVASDLAHQVRIVRFGLPTTTASPTTASGSDPWPLATSAEV